MSFESVKALVADDLQRGRPRHPRRASPATSCWSIRSPNTSSAAAASACARWSSSSLLAPAAAATQRHAEAAAIIEFIHTATLLHDDVVDGSTLRRGRDTANAVWGNEASVLVGDYVYSRAFEMMVSLGNMRIMDVMAERDQQDRRRRSPAAA